MKVKNKKTGEECEMLYFVSVDLANFKTYKTLDDLHKEWEELSE